MNQAIVAVLDGTKARFFILETAEFPEYESGPNLIEHEGLLNSEKERQGQDLWANTKTGCNRGSAGQAHGYDDHRQNHMIEFERRFAQKIATNIAHLARVHQAQRVLLIAEPQILGLMRETLIPVLPKTLELSELAKDLCQLKPSELQGYLANKKLLPACKRASKLA